MIRPPRKGAQISNVDLINRLIEQKLCSVHTSIPGRVEAFDATNGTVDVQPLLKEPCFDAEQNRVDSESYPLIPDVPIRYPCGGGYTITFPLAVGDQGMIEVIEADSEALELSGKESEVTDLRRHDLSFATFVPDFWNRTDLVPVVANAIVIGRRSSGQQLRIGASTVEACSAVSGSSDDFVAMATQVRDELDGIKDDLDAVKTVFDEHVHVLSLAAASGSGGTGTAAPPVTGIALAYSPSTPASSNLKADD